MPRPSFLAIFAFLLGKRLQMQQLLLHIEYLIRHHDCVIMPGVGAFISKRHAASYDESKGLFTAPYRSVSFNAAITNNDGLLVCSIARREGVSYDEASAMLAEEIDKFRSVLAEEKEIEISGVGRLEQRGDRLAFIPTDGQKQASLIGFGTAVAKSLHSGPDVAEEPRKELRNPNYWYVPIHKQTARIAATLIIVLAVALSVILPVTDKGKSPVVDRASVVPVERIEKAVRKVAAKKVECSQESKSELEPEQKPEPMHYLIVGTFHSRDEAKKYLEQQQKRGHELQIVDGRSVVRVAAAASDDEQELRKKLVSPDFKREFAEAWIWTKK